jgi:hypothetical protein
MHLSHRRIDPRAEHGVAMLVVLMALAAGSALAAVAMSAAGADLPFARESQDRKQAYAAAEAGLEYYMFQLGQDNDAWTLCDTLAGPSPSEPSPVNQKWDDTKPDTRRWRKMPDGMSEYTIELLPENGTCTPGATAHESMLDSSSGTFKIRATGRSGSVTRTIVSRLRRRSFLDYIYFTDYETRDPAHYPNQGQSPGQGGWAAENCAQVRASRPSGCQAIQFIDDDEINGPLHTNDNLLTCGSPKFGRDKDDQIESGAGWVRASGCSGSPDFQGTWNPASSPLNVPPTNAGLASVAVPESTFTGKTTIRLNGATMDVTTGTPSVTRTGVPLPANGVIYVKNGACSGTKTPLLQRYDDPAGCAVVYVSGTYSKSLTIGSANDIVITGNIRRDPSADVVLGLIANNNVRVAHPVTRSNWNDTDSCTNATGTMQDVTIDAAILALTHSFVVDNFRCGARLGKLNVTGAIAQKFRGAVGYGSSGYTKNYVYDDRLKYRSPPFFLDPVEASWKVNRSNEQVPAAAPPPGS